MFLSGFSKFCSANIGHVTIKDIVRKSFREFFTYQVSKYSAFKTVPVNATGSVVCIYEDLFREVAVEYGAEVNKIIKDPIDGLVEFHKGGSSDVPK